MENKILTELKKGETFFISEEPITKWNCGEQDVCDDLDDEIAWCCTECPHKDEIKLTFASQNKDNPKKGILMILFCKEKFVQQVKNILESS